jgi:hypothetical protein
MLPPVVENCWRTTTIFDNNNKNNNKNNNNYNAAGPLRAVYLVDSPMYQMIRHQAPSFIVLLATIPTMWTTPAGSATGFPWDPPHVSRHGRQRQSQLGAERVVG